MKPTLRHLARAAVRALYAELALAPKPGLVSFADNGSHADMHAGHFLRSLFALRHYFFAIARAGFDDAPFATLEALGRAAETRMLAATGGVNTHRGGIFLLGLLCAAGGRLLAQRAPLRPDALRDTLQRCWGSALRARAEGVRRAPPRSNGQRAARAHGLRSAGDEAADGFPKLFEDLLPVLLASRAQGVTEDAALVQTLFAALAVLDDTNLVHRGGIEGLRFARDTAAHFLTDGGVQRAGWPQRAQAVHHAFVQRRLSPGGSADLLAAAHWVAAVCEAEGPSRLAAHHPIGSPLAPARKEPALCVDARPMSEAPTPARHPDAPPPAARRAPISRGASLP